MGSSSRASTLRWFKSQTLASPLAFCLIFSSHGCGPGKPPTTQTSASSGDDADSTQFIDVGQAPGRIHVVQQNETLYSLAQKYYGNGQQYTRIYYANRNRLRNPTNLIVGMKLIIP